MSETETQHRRAITAITRLLTAAACPNPEHTARQVLTALTGHGWRPTSARPPPPWQAPRQASAPPSDAYRRARAMLGGPP